MTFLEKAETLCVGVAEVLDELEKAKRSQAKLYDGLEDETEGSESDNPEEEDLEEEDGKPQKVKKAKAYTTTETRMAPQTHRFESFVQRAAHVRGISRTAASQALRHEYPELYRSYVASGLQNNAERAGRSLVVNTDTVTEAATDFEALTQQQQQAYGLSHEAAAARVAILHPEVTHAHNIAKSADTGVSDFMQCVTNIMKRDRLDNRTTAMQRARREHPAEFAKFRNVV